MNVSLTISKKKCIACGSSDFVSFYQAKREFELIGKEKLQFRQNLESCYRCGLVRQQENETYSDANLNKYYSSIPRTPVNLVTLNRKDKRRMNALGRLKFIQKQKPGGTLLEAGFGDGVFLNEARRVYECTGIDPSKGYSYVNQYLGGIGVKIHRGALNSFSSIAAFDVVCSFLVLEHMKAPLVFAAQLKKRLKPNGILIIEVPDIKRYQMFNTESLLTHEHVYHYTIETLALLLSKLDLQLIDYTNKNISYGFSLIAAFKSKRRAEFSLKTSGFSSLKMFQEFIAVREGYRLKMSQILKDLVGERRKTGKKVAVYGTGFLFNFALEEGAIGIDDIDFLYDDTKEKTGAWIGSKQIHPLKEISKHSPGIVLIFSEMFFDLMKENVIRSISGKKTDIINVHEQAM